MFINDKSYSYHPIVLNPTRQQEKNSGCTC